MSTNILAAVNVGIAPNVGDMIYASKTALAAATQHYFLTLQVNLAEREDDRRVVANVYHAWSPTPYVDGPTGAAAIIHRAAILSLPLRAVLNGTLTLERSTPRIDAAAGFLYTWLQFPNLRQVAVAQLVLTEV